MSQFLPLPTMSLTSELGELQLPDLNAPSSSSLSAAASFKWNSSVYHSAGLYENDEGEHMNGATLALPARKRGSSLQVSANEEEDEEEEEDDEDDEEDDDTEHKSSSNNSAGLDLSQEEEGGEAGEEEEEGGEEEEEEDEYGVVSGNTGRVYVDGSVPMRPFDSIVDDVRDMREFSRLMDSPELLQSDEWPMAPNAVSKMRVFDASEMERCERSLRNTIRNNTIEGTLPASAMRVGRKASMMYAGPIMYNADILGMRVNRNIVNMFRTALRTHDITTEMEGVRVCVPMGANNIEWELVSDIYRWQHTANVMVVAITKTGLSYTTPEHPVAINVVLLPGQAMVFNRMCSIAMRHSEPQNKQAAAKRQMSATSGSSASTTTTTNGGAVHSKHKSSDNTNEMFDLAEFCITMAYYPSADRPPFNYNAATQKAYEDDGDIAIGQTADSTPTATATAAAATQPVNNSTRQRAQLRGLAPTLLPCSALYTPPIPASFSADYVYAPTEIGMRTIAYFRSTPGMYTPGRIRVSDLVPRRTWRKIGAATSQKKKEKLKEIAEAVMTTSGGVTKQSTPSKPKNGLKHIPKVHLFFTYFWQQATMHTPHLFDTLEEWAVMGVRPPANASLLVASSSAVLPADGWKLAACWKNATKLELASYTMTKPMYMPEPTTILELSRGNYEYPPLPDTGTERSKRKSSSASSSSSSSSSSLLSSSAATSSSAAASGSSTTAKKTGRKKNKSTSVGPVTGVLSGVAKTKHDVTPAPATSSDNVRSKAKRSGTKKRAFADVSVNVPAAAAAAAISGVITNGTIPTSVSKITASKLNTASKAKEQKSATALIVHGNGAIVNNHIGDFGEDDNDDNDPVYRASAKRQKSSHSPDAIAVLTQCIQQALHDIATLQHTMQSAMAQLAQLRNIPSGSSSPAPSVASSSSSSAVMIAPSSSYLSAAAAVDAPTSPLLHKGNNIMSSDDRINENTSSSSNSNVYTHDDADCDDDYMMDL
jgi:hypothetical protein